ncbi:hypothetical protein CDCA_CDCA10G3057 [Cyanidium caldarium]|uniref:Uncharacterized protein n=1 Tax=Cyanidium caldarium TaxID=2771 RepID=A0AAV9IXH2_CYACA|nr:hypothetical protein CDCA_CDCA10G3057 [Cyanidium caldarium]
MRASHRHGQHRWCCFLFVSLLVVSLALAPSAHASAAGEHWPRWMAAPRRAAQQWFPSLTGRNTTQVIGGPGFFGQWFVKKDPADIGDALRGRWSVDIRVFALDGGARKATSAGWPTSWAILNVVVFNRSAAITNVDQDFTEASGAIGGYLQFTDENGKRLTSAPLRLLRLEMEAPWTATFAYYDVVGGSASAAPKRLSQFRDWFSLRLHRLDNSNAWTTVEMPTSRATAPAMLPLLTLFDRNHFALTLVDRVRNELITWTALRADSILPDSRAAKYGPAVAVGLVYVAAKIMRRALGGDNTAPQVQRRRLIERAARASYRTRTALEEAHRARLVDEARAMRAQVLGDKRD